MFLLLPVFIMAISLNEIVFIVIGSPLLAIFVFAVVVNVLQRKLPKVLPPFLRDWEWLPKPLHSLKPYDRIIAGWSCCARFRIPPEEEEEALDEEEGGESAKKSKEEDAHSSSSGISSDKKVPIAPSSSSDSSEVAKTNQGFEDA